MEVVILYLKRLRNLRIGHNLPQREIAEGLHIDQRVYSNYETGNVKSPQATL
ncbi:helix-turn-helix domain-containing protein [Christensenella tenuis]|uniref:helix-turn-helix domain-containing protein n=1 Tax=Christensenella tenuis TaxID=2763033 RepID=UPI0038B29ACD